MFTTPVNPYRDRYRGRFAPSPTGPLHFGSLVAAVASFLEARVAGGDWLVRIEDVDRPRTVAGASDLILRDLERLGLHWDGEICYQSTRTDAYAAALDELVQAGWTYPCACSRKEVGRNPYPGTCRNGIPAGKKARSIRVRAGNDAIDIRDSVQGPQSQILAATSGDFVVRRADLLHAYHLAVVVDDGAQGITHIVRGADLLETTPAQILLQRRLGLPTPSYAHVPVALNRAGEKLSKQTHAPSINDEPPLRLLCSVLGFLGQHPPKTLLDGCLDDLWHWATAHWRLERVPRRRGIVIDSAVDRVESS